MENTELIKGLRWCADESVCCDDFSGEKCPYYDEKNDSCCSVDEILHAAADALEADEKRIAELLPKEGEWIKHGCEEDEFTYWECPFCGFVGLEYHYCPNCGARMIGEHDEQ